MCLRGNEHSNHSTGSVGKYSFGVLQDELTFSSQGREERIFRERDQLGRGVEGCVCCE
jgi:hypothetical protein